MELIDVVKDLENRFDKPLDEFYNRRIIFWQDPEGEFYDSFDEISIPNVKKLKMTENNKFTVKKILSHDDKESDYLVYCPLVFDDKEDNWIYDMFLYSEEFRADLLSMQISEMNLCMNYDFRKYLRKYKKFFRAKARRDLIEKLSNKIATPAHLELAIMSSIIGCEFNPSVVMREVIKDYFLKNGEIFENLKNYDVDGAFWNMASQGTGYSSDSPKIDELTKEIFLTASDRNIGKEALVGLCDFISTPHDTFCFEFVENWIRNTDERESIYDIAIKVEEEIGLRERLKSLDIQEFYDNELFPCVDEIILYKLMTNIKNNIFDTEFIYAVYDKRRVAAWYKNFELFYGALYYLAKMKDFYDDNQASFHMTSAKEVWKSYTEKFYIMDTYYRKFQRSYQESLNETYDELDDLFKYTVERAEGIYRHWFLDSLLSNWCSVSEEDFKRYGYISGINQQVDFYKNNISYNKTKTYVIISDAMRYEVAKELYSVLKKDMQADIKIEDMEGIFPTITPFGMAALLPNEGLDIIRDNGNIKVLINGSSTEMGNRQNVLKSANSLSTVIRYDDLIRMKRDDRKAAVKGMEVVYIYHDEIDKTSHTSEVDVFAACDRAISELKNLVKILVNDFSAINIMITSDHGFLYTYEEFGEDDKISKQGFDEDAYYGRRFALMSEDRNPMYMMPIKFIDDKSGLKGFAPKQNVRIKKQGGGLNFVHGGISLQEMVVPLIKYRHLRSDNKKYKNNKSKYDVKPVELDLLSTDRKISNMIFNLSFYQKKILENNKQTSYTLYFVDEDGKKISDEVRIIADNMSDDDKDRVFTETFNLKAKSYDNSSIYYLNIVEDTGEIEPKEIVFVIDIPFEMNDYDFFS